MAEQKKRILITGSNGLLGQKLVDLLIHKTGYETFATSKGRNRLPFDEGYTYLELDVTDATQVESVIAQVQPDGVIHTAAMTNVDQCELEKENCWKLNVTATEHLVAACRKHHAFLQHVSTDFVFDGTAGPYREEDSPNPVSFYGWSKYAAEKVVATSDIRWAITRTVLVYGIAYDMSRSNIILWVKNSLKNGKAIQVVTDQFRTPTLAEDLASGCFLIADQQAEGIFHISGKDFFTPYEMAIATADYFNLDKSLISPTDGSHFSQPARRPPKTGFYLDKARAILKYEPHTFSEGIGIMSAQMQKA